MEQGTERPQSVEQCAACGGTGLDWDDYTCQECAGSGIDLTDDELTEVYDLMYEDVNLDHAVELVLNAA